ncbi:Oxidoreductase, short-chain dehydrogenase/reductase family [Olavius sp. associated proteobacterium Delta 1]|nr:Oxidoreductase, short-chain dehydrogenase/reductase family [Olavius sp. associated proteobacterium Delta 1]
MKIIIIGATGTIGKGIVNILKINHELIQVGHSSGDITVDIAEKESIERLFQQAGSFEAVVSAAGAAKFGSFDDMADEDYLLGLTNKLMGQANLVRIGRNYIQDNGSFTLTSGMLSQNPMPGSSSISMVNAGLEGFVRAAALEMPRGVRVNAVSPVWVKETMDAMGMDSASGIAADRTALAYKEAVESQRNGEILDVREFV